MRNKSVFEFGNEEGLAKFIAELIKQGIVFESHEEAHTYVIIYSGGY